MQLYDFKYSYLMLIIYTLLYGFKYVKVYVVQCLPSLEMDTVTWVQILDKGDCISHSTNTLRKGMNPITLSTVMGK